MKKLKVILSIGILTLLFSFKENYTETSSGWVKYENNPVLGGNFGTIFDVTLIKDGDLFKMWSSWRPKKSIALSVSSDAKKWTDPEVVLSDSKTSGWESDVNRPVVVKMNGIYHMWYTGQTWGGKGRSSIGYAKSKDGKSFEKVVEKPVMVADVVWEKTSVMCPHVIWDEEEKIFKMWYSGGEQYEPDAIGYATSKDGINWTKLAKNPIFENDPASDWEKAKVTAC
jgi:predicted GH43/DUF377 family glycosyl hydrolase